MSLALQRDLLEALIDVRTALRAFYDSSEDNPRNPVMQDVGKALSQADKVIQKARSEQS